VTGVPAKKNLKCSISKAQSIALPPHLHLTASALDAAPFGLVREQQ
jgi:hypothetical protein